MYLQHMYDAGRLCNYCSIDCVAASSHDSEDGLHEHDTVLNISQVTSQLAFANTAQVNVVH